MKFHRRKTSRILALQYFLSTANLIIVFGSARVLTTKQLTVCADGGLRVWSGSSRMVLWKN